MADEPKLDPGKAGEASASRRALDFLAIAASSDLASVRYGPRPGQVED